jgi:hypothetical protein
VGSFLVVINITNQILDGDLTNYFLFLFLFTSPQDHQHIIQCFGEVDHQKAFCIAL